MDLTFELLCLTLSSLLNSVLKQETERERDLKNWIGWTWWRFSSWKTHHSTNGKFDDVYYTGGEAKVHICVLLFAKSLKSALVPFSTFIGSLSVLPVLQMFFFQHFSSRTRRSQTYHKCSTDQEYPHLGSVLALAFPPYSLNLNWLVDNKTGETEATG